MALGMSAQGSECWQPTGAECSLAVACAYFGRQTEAHESDGQGDTRAGFLDRVGGLLPATGALD